MAYRKMSLMRFLGIRERRKPIKTESGGVINPSTVVTPLLTVEATISSDRITGSALMAHEDAPWTPPYNFRNDYY